MKKILVMLFVMVLCMAMLTGCGSNAGDNDVIGSSNVVEENTEDSAEDTSMNGETETADSEVIDSSESISEEASEIAEETVMFSAEEVMTHIDTLIAEYQYNDPEHIKALVIAANLDYISEEDLNTILAEYRYTLEELVVLFDECILDNGNANMTSFDYYQGNIDSLSEDKDYANRISISKVMLNDDDANLAQWYDSLLYGAAKANTDNDQLGEFLEQIESVHNNLANSERMMYTYTISVYANEILYNDYLENPYTYYINSNL